MKWVLRSRGFGPPVLLLHGYGGHPRHWDALSTCLEPHFSMTTMNLNHLYFSPQLLNLSEQVDQLHEFITGRFRSEPLRLLGFSYGGALALAYKIKYPGSVKDLVLINPLIPDPIPNLKSWELRLLFKLDLTPRKLQLILASPVGNIYLRRLEDLFRVEAENESRLKRLTPRKVKIVSEAILRFYSIIKSENWRQWESLAKSQFGNLERTLLIFNRGDSLFDSKTYLKFMNEYQLHYFFEIEGRGHMAPHRNPIELSKIIHYFFRYGELQSEIANAQEPFLPNQDISRLVKNSDTGSSKR